MKRRDTRPKFIKTSLTAYELHLIKTLGDTACKLLEIEDKIREFIAPTDEALVPEIDRSIYSQFAEKCVQAITDCISLDEMVADRIFESIFENRDVDRAVALLSEYIIKSS